MQFGMASFLLIISMASSATVASNIVNGSVGESVILPCQLEFTKPIYSTCLMFYWQEDSDTPKVLFIFRRGETEKQDEHYWNRTTAYKDKISSGNISIQINPLALVDDQKTVWAFARLYDAQDKDKDIDSCKKKCRTTLHVSAPFSEPHVAVNYTQMTALCTTHGGFPRPDITWMVQNSLAQKHPVESWKEQTSITKDPKTGTYNVSSSVNVTMNQTVSCQVHNPTSRKIVSKAVFVVPSRKEPESFITGVMVGIVIVVVVGIVIVIVVWIAASRYNMTHGNATLTQGDEFTDGVHAATRSVAVPADNNNGDSEANGEGKVATTADENSELLDQTNV